MGYFEDEADEEYWLEQAEELGEDLDVDTREGSVYMDAAAGHCMRTAKFYSDLSMVFEMLAVDTCGGDILSEKTAMDGIIRTPATSACWSAEFDGGVNIKFADVLGDQLIGAAGQLFGITMGVQAFACGNIGIRMCTTANDRGVACVIAGEVGIDGARMDGEGIFDNGNDGGDGGDGDHDAQHQ